MADHVPPPPKPPVYKTYAERKAAEEKIRNDRNKQTHREYRLPPVPAPGKRKGYDLKDPVPSAGGTPTRDMEPVKLPLARKQDNGQFADVIPLTRKQEDTK